MTEKTCVTCEYGLLPDDVTPCVTCIKLSDGNRSGWKPKHKRPVFAPNNPDKEELSSAVPNNPDKEELPSAILPSHYPPSRHGDVISLCLNGGIGFCEGNIVKYVVRWRKKGGLEDLLKAKQYLDRLIRFNRNKDPQ